MELNELERIVAAGESETVEFKKSTAQITRAGETLCAFLNGQGGRVFVGVTPEGRIVGQQFADSTLRDVAAMLARFDPPALISQDRLRLSNGSEVLILCAPAVAGSGPFTFEPAFPNPPSASNPVLYMSGSALPSAKARCQSGPSQQPSQRPSQRPSQTTQSSAC